MKFKFYATDNHFQLSAQIAQHSMTTHNLLPYEKENGWSICNNCKTLFGLEEYSNIHNLIEEYGHEPPYYTKPLFMSCEELKIEFMIKDIIE